MVSATETPDPGPATSSVDFVGQRTGFFELANVLLRRRRLVASFCLAGALLGILIAIASPARYTAWTTFVPEVTGQEGATSRLAGIAGQLGIAVAQAASHSPEFYAEVLKSRAMLQQVLLASYADPRNEAGGSDSVSLLELLDMEVEDEQVAGAVEQLRDLIAVDVDNQTNIVRLEVSAPHPAIAALIANRLVQLLDEFNTATRQSRARERREFVEGRLVEAEEELREAEDTLQRFYQANRSWQQSPQLVFAESRLSRQVMIRQEVYLTLKREYETARIQEVNETPVITVIDTAAAPMDPARPRRRLIVLMGLSLSALLGVLAAAGAEHMNRVRQEEEGSYREFSTLVGEVRQEAHRFARLVRRPPIT